MAVDEIPSSTLESSYYSYDHLVDSIKVEKFVKTQQRSQFITGHIEIDVQLLDMCQSVKWGDRAGV